MTNINTAYNEIFSSYPNIEIKEHIKKLIELDFYYPYNATFFCITNTVNQNFEYVSKNFTACTGLSRDEMIHGGMNFFWSLFHPEDITLWLECLKDLMTFTMNNLNDEQRKRMSYTWNYRIKNGNGKYTSIIQNTTPLQFDHNNKPVIGLAHYTVLNEDVKMDICACAKYLNEKNEYETLYYKNISSQNLLGVISNRERDIIRLLLLQKTSIEISESLHISKHTVDTHRRNILKKLQMSSTFELENYFKNNRNLI
ncbi:LuxR C-terminal-related transcriptional regulator [Polaribacter gangjinensis]|uniref:Helix-turn-helix transcriptional regulator n=1 Tax=Polaribacter gangjinensis TaxID=574710 RepID=A0A2S7W8D9_9FLAO|nr:LuxR C-terminal-related transcriptional regulator [Polaribacter gangjinensis]PQJ73879.1 helix-turn-helix transcriptional regulator [Polaribacter gangjinensis]